MILECYNLLKQMEPQPAMWTGENSLKSIHTYINGYYNALLDHKVFHRPDTIDPFFDWVANRLGYYESTAGWSNMILAYSMGFKPDNISWEELFDTTISNEQQIESIKIFYKLIEDFKDEIEK